MISKADFNFLLGCCLGDGCLSKEQNYGSVMLKYSHKATQGSLVYDTMLRVNEILSTKATCRHYLDNGHPAVGFGASSKAVLNDCYELLYPLGKKVFTKRLLRDLGLSELAYFFMDDGSLEVRTRSKPRRKVERTAWLAVSHDQEEVDAVHEWIYELTGASGRVVRHRSGMLYLRWHALQCRNLVSSVRPYVHPCVAYKVDFDRACSVAEWLTANKHIIDISKLPIEVRQQRNGPSEIYPLTIDGLMRLDSDIERTGGIACLAKEIECVRQTVSRHRERIISFLTASGAMDASAIPSMPRAKSGGPSDLYPRSKEGLEKLTSDIKQAGSMAKLAKRLGCTPPSLGDLRQRIILSLGE
jgi:hypothetical protein